MAHSFGPAPRFHQYCDWALEAGCDVRSGIAGKRSLTRITAPSGKYVIQAGVEKDEVLDRQTVAFLDRRLGLESPFPKAPSGY